MYISTNIIEAYYETDNIKTIKFQFSKPAKPGQFVMIWIPHVDEFPMSLSYIHPVKGVTFKIIGKGTTALAALSIGARIWVRGPYGTYYHHDNKRILAIAGGTGIASLAPFLELQKNFDLILGAKSVKQLFFVTRLKRVAKHMFITTEDGSYGRHGVVTDILPELLRLKQYSKIYACGPEKMIKAVLKIALIHKIEIIASLERFMKCGIGICDSCTINGFRVCVDGPVFRSTVLQKMTDLGKI